MPPRKKFRSIKRKKRQFTGNKYTRQSNSEQTSATGAGILNEEMSSESSSESSVDQLVQIETKDVSASARKLDLESSSEDEIELPESTEGFRYTSRNNGDILVS